MRKIPTLLVRDTDDLRHVTDDVHPDCDWVLAGEGVATRKYDGTCVMFDGESWWARRIVKPDKATPDGFLQVDFDSVTGKTVGWEPMEASGFAKAFQQAVNAGTPVNFDDTGDGVKQVWLPGTYELVGPKINGNPEGMDQHMLLRHADAQIWTGIGHQRGIEHIKADVSMLGHAGWEGLVWHHPDGRMAKLKARDLA